MTDWFKKIEDASPAKLFWGVIIASMLLATWMQYIQHGWINPDSVLYFEGARLFALGEWQQAVNVFRWPLYALSIAAIHKVTSLSIHTSAQVLSVIFFGIATASFIKIIDLAGGKAKAILAGALILFSSQYIVGDVLEMLLRDQGFWAFFLTSLVFFIRFYKTRSVYDALLWQLCAITATLFRIEGVTYLIGLPLILLFTHQQTNNRVRHYFISNSLSILAISSILVSLMLSNELSMKSFGRLSEVFTSNFYYELTKQFFEKSRIMSEQVLGGYLEEFATAGLILTFLYVMVVKAFSTTGFFNVGLAFFSIKSHKKLINNEVFLILKVTVFLALINMALIITKVFVLSGRYVVPLAFVLMIIASMYLADTLKYLVATKKADLKKKWLVIALLAFMLMGVIKNMLPKQEGYNYMQDAISWLKENNVENKPVFYNEPRLRYYAGAPFLGKWSDNWRVVMSEIENGSVYRYDYLVINHSSEYPERELMILEKLPMFVEVKRLNERKHKKSIVIYKKLDKQLKDKLSSDLESKNTYFVS